MKNLSVADRLGLVNYRNQGRSDAKAHIEVDTDICNSGCPHLMHDLCLPCQLLYD